MAKDLRTFLDRLEKEAPELLVRIQKEVSPHFEATGLMWNLEQQGKCPVCIFENIPTVNGKKSDFKVISNVFADRRSCAVAMDLTKDQWRLPASLEFGRREENLIDPITISAKEAPVKQVIKRGAEVDLRDMPVLTYHQMDGMPYINTVAIVQDPDVPGVYNGSHHRQVIKGPQTTGFFTSPRHLWNYMNRAHARGEELPLVQVIGHHPAFYLGSETLAPMEASEYSVIGGILGEPLRLVPSETWGDKFMVPADAEIILEGVMVPNKREAEGPYGEWTGYFGPLKWGWVFEARALTYRKDAHFLGQYIGHRDAANLGGISKEGGVFNTVKKVVPTVQAVHIPWSGMCRMIVYISIDQKAEGEARFAALATFPLHDEIKIVIVVDKDVDVFNERDVWWAVATRSQPKDDIEIIKKARGGALDPSQEHPQWGSKLIIDATKPVEGPFAEKLSIAPEVLKKMDPKDYIPKEILDAISSVV